MKYKEKIVLTEKEKAFVTKMLEEEPQDASGCMGEDETFTKTAVFGDGMEMDVKLCGVRYEEDSDNRPWTEAVLFKNGCEVCCSEPGDEFTGEWELEAEGNTYTANVIGIEELLNDLMYEMYAQPAWAAHCYAFEFLPEYSDPIARQLEETEEKEEAAKLKKFRQDASDEFERIASSDRLNFMRPEDTEKLEELDRRYLKEVCHAAQTVVRSLGITDEYLQFEEDGKGQPGPAGKTEE